MFACAYHAARELRPVASDLFDAQKHTENVKEMRLAAATQEVKRLVVSAMCVDYGGAVGLDDDSKLMLDTAPLERASVLDARQELLPDYLACYVIAAPSDASIEAVLREADGDPILAATAITVEAPKCRCDKRAVFCFVNDGTSVCMDCLNEIFCIERINFLASGKETPSDYVEGETNACILHVNLDNNPCQRCDAGVVKRYWINDEKLCIDCLENMAFPAMVRSANKR